HNLASTNMVAYTNTNSQNTNPQTTNNLVHPMVAPANNTRTYTHSPHTYTTPMVVEPTKNTNTSYTNTSTQNTKRDMAQLSGLSGMAPVVLR
ncbi:MAG: hypothetical protein ASUL_09874, partial [Candidatus Aramenus sulfurataquae]